MTTSAATIPIFDGHNDVLLRLENDPQSFFQRQENGHVDLPRARQGGLGGGFCAVFTRFPPREEGRTDRDPMPTDFPPTPDWEYAQRRTLAAIARLFRLERDSEGQLRVIRNAAEIEECLQTGVFAALLHIEGAESIDPELNALEVFHAAGLRSLGPVWSRPNAFGEGVPFNFGRTPDTGPGLTDLGKALVRACNQLGILVDLSHLNDQGFWDVAAISNRPLVATHSNAWSLAPATRNLTDRQLDAIRDSDGMVGVNFAVAFLREDGAPEADTPLSEIVRHVDFLVERIGIERVGFGSDFDGAMIPAALGDAGGLPHLLDALRQAGYDDAALRRLAHENWVRVLRQTWGG